MRKILLFLIFFLIIFIFGVFYKGLNKFSLYEPNNELINVPTFSAKTFFDNNELNSNDIFYQNKYYLLNIWSSWCVPCRDEHFYLVNLGKVDQLEIIGMNYKDKPENAIKFLNELGNPFNKILIDADGTKAIEWGAYGVPESFLIFNNKIVKKFIGPLDAQSIKKIKELVK